MHRFSTFGLLLLLATGLTVTGCGDGRLCTRGRVVKGGQPFIAKEGEFLQVTFIPMLKEKNGKELPPNNFYWAVVDQATGTFTAAGGDLKGIPAEKYIVHVALMKDKKDLFKGKYDANPPVVDVDSSVGEIAVELESKASKAS